MSTQGSSSLLAQAARSPARSLGALIRLCARLPTPSAHPVRPIRLISSVVLSI